MLISTLVLVRIGQCAVMAVFATFVRLSALVFCCLVGSYYFEKQWTKTMLKQQKSQTTKAKPKQKPKPKLKQKPKLKPKQKHNYILYTYVHSCICFRKKKRQKPLFCLFLIFFFCLQMWLV